MESNTKFWAVYHKMLRSWIFSWKDYTICPVLELGFKYISVLQSANRRKLVNTAPKREMPRNIVRTANIPRLMSGFSAFEESTIFSPRCTLTAVGRFNCTLNMEIILTNSFFCVGKEDFQHLILIIFATSSRWYIRSENIQFLIGEGFTKLMFDV